MATLYEIDSAIMECVDLDTGEIIDSERLEALEIERTNKIESVALWVKNLKADLGALEAERKAFQERERNCKGKIESLEKWLLNALDGKKFETPKVKISFRKSEAVEIFDESEIPNEYIRETVLKAPDKSAIKDALKTNFQIAGAKLITRKNIQIK